jgi:hypothetical protein
MAMEEDEGRGYCYAGRESTLKHMLCGGNFLTRPPTGRYFSPVLPSARLSFTARIQQNTNVPSKLARCSPRKDTRCWSYCGRRARPFLGRAFREQGTSTGALPPPLTFPSFPIAHRIHVRRPCNGCNPIRP